MSVAIHSGVALIQLEQIKFVLIELWDTNLLEQENEFIPTKI